MSKVTHETVAERNKDGKPTKMKKHFAPEDPKFDKSGNPPKGFVRAFVPNKGVVMQRLPEVVSIVAKEMK